LTLRRPCNTFATRVRQNSGVVHPDSETAGGVVRPAASAAAKRAATLGRNEPCPCGSGKKYKKCCGPGDAEAARSVAVRPVQMAPLLALLHSQQHADLERETRRLLAQNSKDGLLWKLLAHALWAQGQDPLDALEQTAALRPQDPEAHSNLGNLLRARGQLEQAVASHRRAIECAPNYAEGYNNLGSVLNDLGRTTEAAGCYRRAIELKGSFALAHANLGSALLLLGRFEESIRSFEQALALNAQLADARRQLGSAMRQLGRLSEAVMHLCQVVSERPSDVTAHKLLGATLLELGHYADAEATYRRVIELSPGEASAYADLAAVLVQYNRPVEAEENCREALRLDPRSVGALLMLGELEAAKGHFADAEGTFRLALQIDPNNPEALAGIVRWQKMRSPDPEWLAEARRVAELPLPPRRRARLCYALGKYFDDLDSHAQAFEQYHQANELEKTYAPRYEPDRHRRYVDELAHHYNQSWFANFPSRVEGSERVVFIVGMWRSGTTLAEQILAAHPAVSGAGELPFWTEVGIRLEADGLVPASRREEIAGLAKQYLEMHTAAPAGATRAVDKMASNYLHLGLIHAGLPQARIIHMRRHPIATCLSIYFQDLQGHAYANDLDDLRHYYSEYTRVMEHWRGILPPGTLLEVSYEELLQNQEATTRAMLDFIGLPWDGRCLEFYRAERAVLTRSKWQVRQPINQQASERWRKYEPFIAPLLPLA
jgi:tetratricopeptide (TPR) repeat protein